MNAIEIMKSEDFKKCVDFHGHVCPGLSIGYVAAKAGLDALKASRSEDEEIVAIVETDACCSDAVQVITGCTFGKGNFIYKDYGKIAFTFFNRDTGQGVRLIMKPDGMGVDKEHRELLQKVMANSASQEEQEKFEKLHLERSCQILEKPIDELFFVMPAKEQMPERAKIEPSIICSACKEPVMPSKAYKEKDKILCRACV